MTPFFARESRIALVFLIVATAIHSLWNALFHFRYVHPDTFAQLAWMHRWADPSALPGDICADYFRTFHIPPGLRAIYYVLVTGLGLSILLAAKIVTTVAAIVTFSLLYQIGRAFGPTGSLCVLAVGSALTASDATQAIGPFMTAHTGLPRSFAVPTLLAVLLGISLKRVLISSLGLLAGVLFYPPAFVIGCATIGLYALSLGRLRPMILCCLSHIPAGILSIAVVLLFYPALEQERYGRLFTFDESITMPEFRTPGAISVTEPMLSGESVLSAAVVPWARSFWPLLVLVVLLAGLRNEMALPLALMSAASLICAVAAIVLWFRLYEPSRYWVYPFRAMLTPAAGALLAAFLTRVSRKAERYAAFIVIAVALFEVLTFATRLAREADSPADVSRPIRDALMAASPDAVVAFYPGDGDWVPLETKHPGFLSSIALFPYHNRFHSEVITRYTSLRDVVYATDLQAVRRLRDVYGVRYLLVTKTRFEPEAFRFYLTQYPGVMHLEYLTRALAEGGPDRPFILKTPPSEAVIATEGDDVLIDLERI